MQADRGSQSSHLLALHISALGVERLRVVRPEVHVCKSTPRRKSLGFVQQLTPHALPSPCAVDDDGRERRREAIGVVTGDLDLAVSAYSLTLFTRGLLSLDQRPLPLLAASVGLLRLDQKEMARQRRAASGGGAAVSEEREGPTAGALRGPLRGEQRRSALEQLGPVGETDGLEGRHV